MNEKHVFLRRLRAALDARNIPQADYAPYIERFDRYYDRMLADSSGDTAALLDDTERFADNIAEQLVRKTESSQSLERAPFPESEKAPEPEQLEVADEISPVAEAEPDDGSDESPLDFRPSPSSRPAELSPEDSPPTAEYNSAVIERTMKPAESESIAPDEYIDSDEAPTGTLFWVLFAVSLPILIPLAAAGFSVFLALWAALAALALGSILLLVVGVGAGSALALVGIIYGITQLFDQLPVGLYELGLGIMIGGAVMFAGILLYNLAIRLVPLLVKLVGRLFIYCCKRLKQLFDFLRRECARL